MLAIEGGPGFEDRARDRGRRFRGGCGDAWFELGLVARVRRVCIHVNAQHVKRLERSGPIHGSRTRVGRTHKLWARRGAMGGVVALRWARASKQASNGVSSRHAGGWSAGGQCAGLKRASGWPWAS
eukprot:15485253-Alexandrium_andersonii.AAC.1